MKLVPLGDRVVLKQVAAETTTKSGIVIPGSEKEKPQQAQIIAVGWQGSYHAGKGWSDCYLLQVCRNRGKA